MLGREIKYALQDINQFADSMRSPGEYANILKFLFNGIRFGEFGSPLKIKDYSALDSVVEKNNRIELEMRKHGMPIHDHVVMLLVGHHEHPSMYFDCTDSFREEGMYHMYWGPLHHFRNAGENADYIIGLGKHLLAKTGKKKLDVIPHSRGGLIAAYAAILCPDIFDKIIAVGTPFHGTTLAGLGYDLLEGAIGRIGIRLLEKMGYSLDPIREMRFNSEFTQHLNENISRLKGVDLYSIFSMGYDEAVIPGCSSIIDHNAVNINVDSCLDISRPGHIGLALHDKVHEIEFRILKGTFDKEGFLKEHPVMKFEEYLKERTSRTRPVNYYHPQRAAA